MAMDGCTPGDVGEFDGIFLKITDRKKEIFKTSGGKYIAPQQIENRMKESKFIAQIMVVGENRKFPAAIDRACISSRRRSFRAKRCAAALKSRDRCQPGSKRADRIRNPAIERTFRALLADQKIRPSARRNGRWPVVS